MIKEKKYIHYECVSLYSTNYDNAWHIKDYKAIQLRLGEIQISFEEARSKGQRHVTSYQGIWKHIKTYVEDLLLVTIIFSYLLLSIYSRFV